MIAILSRLLGGSTVAAWLIVALVGAGALGGGYLWAQNQGYQRASLAWELKYQERELELERQRFAELDRQALANDRAKASEAARLAQLRNDLTALERQLKEHADEAAIDPNADRIGLGVDSVRRINGVR